MRTIWWGSPLYDVSVARLLTRLERLFRMTELNEQSAESRNLENPNRFSLESLSRGGSGFERVDRVAAIEAIRRISEEDLRFLNRLIVERLRLISQARSMVMLARFNVGDRVSFQGTSGERKGGVIVRINKKSASIATGDGQHWNVHPSLLTLITPGEAEPRQGPIA
jgi:hypothetical protein